MVYTTTTKTMIFCGNLKTVIVITLTILGHARSQGDEVRSGVVNGPTGISVEAVEQRGFSRGPTNVVNGPTAFSVEAEELQNNGGLYKVVEEDLGDAVNDGKGQIIESDVDLDTLRDDGRPVVNGPTGSSVQQQEQMANNRGRISTDPKDNKRKIPIPKGYHMDTTDWSTDSPHWTFKAGEWEMISLPDADKHHSLPAPEVPGPALVVVTQEHLKKVYVAREVEGLSGVTLHYRYYLSEGEYPNGIPELKVYQVIDELHTTMLSFETTLGRWSDTTVGVPDSDTKFKILFEGRLNKLGNEIAIDDITISAISSDASGVNNTDAPGAPLPEGENATTQNNAEEGKEGTVKPGQEIDGSDKPEESGTTTRKPKVSEGVENAQDTETELHGESVNMTKSPEDIGTLHNVTDFPLQGNDTIDIVTGDGSLLPLNETNATANGANIENNEQGTQAFTSGESTQVATQGNDTLEVTKGPQYTLEKGEVAEYNVTDIIEPVDNVTVPAGTDVGSLLNETGVNELLSNATIAAGANSSLDNYTKGPNINLTEISIPTTDGRVTIGANITDIENSTLPTNVTVIPESNSTYSPANVTLSPGAGTTVLPTNINQTGPVVTPNITNSTGVPANNGTNGGINATDVSITMDGTTPGNLITNPLSNATTDQGTNSNATATTLIIPSTSPSGYNGTTPGNFTGAGSISANSGNHSWGAFKIFLVIGLLGIIILGLLYWRRQRRRDDEIPVFSRSSHADYPNPTFTEDDEHFASRGTAQNYKSFN